MTEMHRAVWRKSRRGGRRWGLTAMAVIPLSIAVVACSPGGASTGPTTGGGGTAGDNGAVTIVQAEEPTSLDPCDSNNSSRSRILRQNVTESLTKRNPDTNTIEPLLATQWSSSADNTTWTFELRQGVTFQNGEAFDADAVVKAMNRLFDKNLACDDASSFFNPPTVVSTKATGQYEVTFTLDQADPIFPLRMTYIQIGAPSTSTTDKTAPAIGTGPYQITDWARGQDVQLTRYDGYWGTKPSIQSAKFVFRSDSSVRASMIQTGEADLAVAVSPQDVPDDPGVTKEVFEDGETTYFRIDAEVAPLDDIRLREALNLATDRKGIIDSIFGGLGTPAHEIFLPETVGYNTSLKDWDYDPAKAKQLVQQAAAAGVDVTKQIILYGRADFYPGASEVAQALASAWNAIGLNVKVQNLDSEAWGQILLRPHKEGRDPNILLSSHGNTTGDASFTVVEKYTCNGSQSASCDPTFDSLVQQALATADTTKRGELFAQAMAEERNNVVQDIPLAYMQEIFLTSKHLTYKTTIQSDFELRIADMSLS